MTTTRARAGAVLAAVVLGLTGGLAVTQTGDARAAGETHAQRAQSSLTIGGCVVRLTPSGPRIHANSSHTCVGVKGVRITAQGRLQIMYTTSRRSVALTAGADETLTSRGIRAGVNGTRTYATVTLYDGRLERRLHLRRAADYRRAAGWTSNVWFGSVRSSS